MSDNNKQLKHSAQAFIAKCNVVPLVHAKEGGIVELESLLIDFATSQEVWDWHVNENSPNIMMVTVTDRKKIINT